MRGDAHHRTREMPRDSHRERGRHRPGGGGALPPTVMFIRCKHVRRRDRQSRRKSVQRAMELCMPRGCEGEGAFPWGGLAMGRCDGHTQASRQAKHCAHRGILMLMLCDKAFQDPCHSETREQSMYSTHQDMYT